MRKVRLAFDKLEPIHHNSQGRNSIFRVSRKVTHTSVRAIGELCGANTLRPGTRQCVTGQVRVHKKKPKRHDTRAEDGCLRVPRLDLSFEMYETLWMHRVKLLDS